MWHGSDPSPSESKGGLLAPLLTTPLSKTLLCWSITLLFFLPFCYLRILSLIKSVLDFSDLNILLLGWAAILLPSQWSKTARLTQELENFLGAVQEDVLKCMT